MDQVLSVVAFLRMLQFERNRSPRTIRAYYSDLRDLQRAFPGIELTQLTTGLLREYLQSQATRGLRDATVRRRIAVLKSYYHFLESEGIVQESPARKIRGSYTIARRIPRVMAISQIEAVLRAAHEAASLERSRTDRRLAIRRRNLAMVEILFATGMRSDELVKLDLRDLDLERKTLMISGKGRRERQIPISSEEAFEAVESYLLARSALLPRCQALFVNRLGQRLHVQSVRIVFAELSGLAGLNAHYTPHALRHSMATYLVENGADVRSAQEILGHSSIRTTQIYLEVSRERKQAVLSQFNQRNRLRIRNS